MSNETFIIFNVSELNKIDFSQVEETSIDTVRKSVNKLKTFVKWVGNTPSCVQTLTTKEGPYTYEEITNILSTSDWANSSGPKGYCS